MILSLLTSVSLTCLSLFSSPHSPLIKPSLASIQKQLLGVLVSFTLCVCECACAFWSLLQSLLIFLIVLLSLSTFTFACSVYFLFLLDTVLPSVPLLIFHVSYLHSEVTTSHHPLHATGWTVSFVMCLYVCKFAASIFSRLLQLRFATLQ